MTDMRFKPIYLTHQAGVSPTHVRTVINGISQVLGLAGVANLIAIHNLGMWRDETWRSSGELLPHASVDWYIQAGKRQSTRRNQLLSDAIVSEITHDLWQESQPHYEVMILESDIYCDNCNFIVGQAMKNVLAIVSVNRFLSLDNDLQQECIKTVAMHEIGHMFGIPSHDRTDGSLSQSLGNHCTNTCIMRQGLSVPTDFIRMTKDRLRNGPFCGTCIGELREFFL